MKTKTYMRLLGLLALFLFGTQTAKAQEIKSQTKIKTDAVKVKSESKVAVADDDTKRVESLSGINLFPDRKTGNFRLRFTQNLKDSANLELKDAAGQVLFAKALSASESYTGKPMELGNLDAGIYLIEVKSANTTYWKKVRIKK